MTNIFRSLFGLSLAIQMILATVLALAVGIFFGERCSIFGPWSSAYILILKITTIPYLICAILHGIGNLNQGIAKQILQKGILFIGITWFINVCMIYLGVFLFPESKGNPYASFSLNPSGHLDFAALLIPDNIFYALSNNVVPSVVVFVLLVGISLMYIKEKSALMGLLETLVDSFTRITGWIARITPIGTFLIIANQAGTVQFSIMKQMGTYLFLYIFIILLVVFWIFPSLVNALTELSFGRWVKALLPILILAYTTNVVIVTIPFIIELIKREISAIYHKEGKFHDQVQGVVSVVFNLPLGSLFITFFIFFIASFYHIPLNGTSQVQLFLTTFFTSLGASGLGSWINSLNFLLDTLGLPAQATDLYLATIPFTAGFQSMISAMEISSLSLLIVLACHNLILFRLPKVIKALVLTATPVLLLIFALKIVNPLPPITNPSISIKQIELKSPVTVKVYTDNDPLPPPRTGDIFTEILRTQTLRIGYNADIIPFCFKNSLGNLAGFDVAFAYELAKDLGCSLEFIPLHFGKIEEELKAGKYDIGMSGISITEERLKKISFTSPYQNNQICFVMLKNLRKNFSSIEEILASSDIKVCVLTTSSYEELALKIFPKEQIISLNSYDEFTQYSDEAILIRGSTQAISWSLNHPHFTVVTPKPSIGQESLSYALHPESGRLLSFLNLWLELKKNEKFTEEQYSLWVLGKTEEMTPPAPRWSVVQNILHWDD